MSKSPQPARVEGPATLLAVLSEVAAALEEDRPSKQPTRLVERRCPYCHDGLGDQARVLCAGCATPHHAACFREHGGCSLLGCETERSLDTEGPSSRIICAACAELTPSNGPYCAKCGARHAAEAWGNQASQRTRLLRFLGSSAALLLLSWSAGSALGTLRQRATRVHLHAAERGHVVQRRAALHEHLRAIQRAQVLFADQDLDGDGEFDYARSSAELSSALAAACEFDPPPGYGERLSEARWDLERAQHWGYEPWEIELTRTGAGRQVALGRLPDSEASRWSCDLEGRITRVSEGDDP